MARLARVIAPGLPHHLVQKGIRGCNVFLDRTDRDVYEQVVRRQSQRHGVNILAYCWMTNHVHLVVVPKRPESIGLFMRDTNGPYASYFNRKNGFSGHLWQARFYSCVLDDDHLWAAIRYVERNPVRAAIARRAEAYPWSSASAHCGLRRDPLLAPLPVDENPIRDWSAWLSPVQPSSELNKLRANTATGRPLGSEAFILKLESSLGILLRYRRRGRPAGRK